MNNNKKKFILKTLQLPHGKVLEKTENKKRLGHLDRNMYAHNFKTHLTLAQLLTRHKNDVHHCVPMCACMCACL